MLEVTFVDLDERISAISEEDAMYKSGESIQLS
ncbi:pantocin A family RiPP [Stenotrophomonas sp. ISL-67]|nr:pantocin A family RiPP [Stenotrophomonas sp. ISL-67]MBT2766488.1 pantocin A family RiPP [Stenotrophomonas sp. ISL-67]